MEPSKDRQKQFAIILGIVSIAISISFIGLLFWFYSNIDSKLESMNKELKSSLDNANGKIASQQEAIRNLSSSNSQLSAKLTELEHKLEPQLMVDYRIGDPNVQWFNCVLTNCAVAQSFMPTYDIEVDRVGAAFLNATGTVIFTIRHSTDGDVLATTSSAPIVKNGWTELPLEKPLLLTKGTQYFLRWDTVVDEKTLFVYKIGSPYPNGHGWAKTTYGWTPQVTEIADIDYAFKLESHKP